MILHENLCNANLMKKAIKQTMHNFLFLCNGYLIILMTSHSLSHSSHKNGKNSWELQCVQIACVRTCHLQQLLIVLLKIIYRKSAGSSINNIMGKQHKVYFAKQPHANVVIGLNYVQDTFKSPIKMLSNFHDMTNPVGYLYCIHVIIIFEYQTTPINIY